MNQPVEGPVKLRFVLKYMNDSGQNLQIIVFGKEVMGGLRYRQQSVHKQNQSFNFSVSESYRTVEIKGSVKYLEASVWYSGKKRESIFWQHIYNHKAALIALQLFLEISLVLHWLLCETPVGSSCSRLCLLLRSGWIMKDYTESATVFVVVVFFTSGRTLVT